MRNLRQPSAVMLSFAVGAILTAWSARAQGTPEKKYDFDIVFNGLVAFVAEANHTYALFPDADYPEVDGDLKREHFPPCAWGELSGDPADLKHFYPRHLARLRFRQATVVRDDGHDVSNDTIDVSGEDVVVIGDASQIPPEVSRLRHVASSTEVLRSRPDSHVLPARDRVLQKYLTESDPGKLFDGRLATRIRVDGGQVVTSTLDRCNKQQAYSFSTHEEECLGTPQRLVEQVSLEMSYAPPLIIKLLTSGRTLTVTPKHSSWPATIQFLNAHADLFGKCPKEECDIPPHLSTYRWYYRLSAVDSGADCPKDFFPCEYVADGFEVTAGGAKCPQAEFQP